jgi:hypothetical protein
MELNVVLVVKKYFTVEKHVNRNRGNYIKDRVKRWRKQRKMLRNRQRKQRKHHHYRLVEFSVLQDVVCNEVTLVYQCFFAVIVVWVHFIVAENVN